MGIAVIGAFLCGLKTIAFFAVNNCPCNDNVESCNTDLRLKMINR